jgi:hypothetical protein
LRRTRGIPEGEEGVAAWLRIEVSAAHTDADIEGPGAALGELKPR